MNQTLKETDIQLEIVALLDASNKTKKSLRGKRTAKTPKCFNCKESGHLVKECPV